MVGLNVKKVMISYVVYAVVLVAISTNRCFASKEKCSTCKSIIENFKEGLEKTKKSNFGGGNTRWEEKSLGTWAHSETRLVEIWDNYLCKHDSKECHFMLEKHEEDLEEFWFNIHAKNEDADMHEWFCINKIKVCCPDNTYGPKCNECTGGKNRPCKGNGKCDGEGTREGTGKCKCDSGYHGDLCDECTDGYFEENKNDTHTQCTACHVSCKSTCWEAGPKGCDECKSGWTTSENDGCQDIDECPDTPCDENQYCTNTQGSYHCATCHRSCHGCHGYGSHKCEECKEGYNKVDENCLDVNECEVDKTLCSGEKQSCENTEGSYKCKCEGDLIYEAGSQTCIPKPKEGEEENDEGEKSLEKEEL
ncbi:cysteine-rich with EGF-like domain protein 2 isoform X2 [Mercenaria mercenaria]|uniref:cysteine-rich with EGF-like domain protein 2 isoform X2 n=1 Tax=Mercenaria mercenaria TaxID=6596 RepID=UPI00234F1942|nr:cysteine-rich with EGF-like domain protein 2 isoform X2 [Mercenaria mercenaria]